MLPTLAPGEGGAACDGGGAACIEVRMGVVVDLGVARLDRLCDRVCAAAAYWIAYQAARECLDDPSPDRLDPQLPWVKSELCEWVMEHLA